jgi:deoxyguanosine kinase
VEEKKGISKVKVKPFFVAVEGPIGVGKTSLARILASRLDAYLLKEIVEENPFLDKFYQNREEWSFQTEMFFLCHRFKQLEDVQKDVLGNQLSVVADYHIFKNLIFAHKNLHLHHFEKYKHIYKTLTEDLPSPSLVIYLRAGIETLMQRIKQRGRDFEQNMDRDYLSDLSNAYDQFMYQFQAQQPQVKVITLNGDQLDFVHRKEDQQVVIKTVFNALNMEMNLA